MALGKAWGPRRRSGLPSTSPPGKQQDGGLCVYVGGWVGLGMRMAWAHFLVLGAISILDTEVP